LEGVAIDFLLLRDPAIDALLAIDFLVTRLPREGEAAEGLAIERLLRAALDGLLRAAVEDEDAERLADDPEWLDALDGLVEDLLRDDEAVEGLFLFRAALDGLAAVDFLL